MAINQSEIKFPAGPGNKKPETILKKPEGPGSGEIVIRLIDRIAKSIGK